MTDGLTDHILIVTYTWKTERVCFLSARCSMALRRVKSERLMSAASRSVAPEERVSRASCGRYGETCGETCGAAYGEVYQVRCGDIWGDMGRCDLRAGEVDEVGASSQLGRLGGKTDVAPHAPLHLRVKDQDSRPSG